jgi:flavin-dependent dehydrogenase
VEVNVERSPGDTSGCDVPCLDYGAIEHGYGWVFPKDDHCCVGLYTLAPKTRDIRGRLIAYLHSKGFRDVRPALTGFEAARIPVGGHFPRVPDCPVYVTGDAGGFADALTGEGIYAALESGRIAGEVAVDVTCGRGDHRAYYRRLWRPVLLDTAATFHAARHFYGDVDRGIRILQSPLVWRPLIQGGAAASTFCGCFMKSAFYLPRSLAGGSAAHRSLWTSGQPQPA